MDRTERDRLLNERRKAFYENDFNPPYAPETTPPPEARQALAAEYAAFQLGQINRKLDRLIAAFERLAGSQPDQRSYSERKRDREEKQ